MLLTKDDLKQIRVVVKEEINGSEKRIDGKFDNFGKRLSEKIDSAVDTLAIITKRGFDENTKEHAKFIKNNEESHIVLLKGQQQIRKDISNLEFIATEMVRRDEFLEVKARLAK